jgi:hypothetical protein
MPITAELAIIQAPDPNTEMVYLDYIPIGLAFFLIVLTIYLFIR